MHRPDSRRCVNTAVVPLVGALLAAAIFPAAADDGKQRYVSGAGRDQGDCLNRFRPCRTLSYAISRAGKADIVSVAEGEYTISDTAALLDVLGSSGRIAAGYSKYSGYSEKNASERTFLTGVPPEFRERFEAAGFTVIVDSKGIATDESKRMRKLAAQFLASEQSHAAAPCVGNQSGGFPCDSVSLQSHVSLQTLRPSSTRGNDVWGYTDLNTQREYAIMGLENGVAVLDITDPQAPEEVGIATGSSTTWRDIGVYQRYDSAAKRWRAYAYVTADRANDFLMVLDLSSLPNGIQHVNYSSDFRSAHTNYLVNADYMYGIAATGEAPQLAISGAGVDAGNFRLYSLADPRSPSLVTVSNRGYAHDLGSYAISDARKNTQCVNAGARSHCQVLTDFNENTVDVWDVTTPAAPQQLVSLPYTNARYVHSGFWTENGRYLFVHDELDERDLGINTTIRVFDMGNLRAPTLAGTWVGPNRSIDHNGAVRGSRYYVANYSEGLTVLDIRNPVAPTRIGYFDTFPSSGETGFVGAWSVYPFFASGTIAIGDINTGLYLLRDEAPSSTGAVTFATPSLGAIEGQTVPVVVRRMGGSLGVASVEVDVLHASSDTTDVAPGTVTQTLTWGDGDSTDKTATITLAADATNEDLDLLLVRLRNPVGAALAAPDSMRLYIADAGKTTRLRLLEEAPTVDETRGRALVTVSRQASATGVARVNYRTLPNPNYSGFTSTQGELTWSDGDASAKTIPIAIDASRLAAGQSATFQVELFSATNAELETSAGATATTLLATVTVNDTTTPAPSPTPGATSRRGGGGGGLPFTSLIALLLLLAHRRGKTLPA